MSATPSAAAHPMRRHENGRSQAARRGVRRVSPCAVAADEAGVDERVDGRVGLGEQEPEHAVHVGDRAHGQHEGALRGLVAGADRLARRR